VGVFTSEPRRHALVACLTGSVLCGIALLGAPRAAGIVQRATTVDGPSTAIVDFGGIAIASDGTGGLVYTKNVDGVPHVFAARYNGNRWSPPFRVDWDQPFDASQPRIAADDHGRLLVVWVTQTATVGSRIQRGLFSASLGRGASGFAPALLVDPNVGNGVGVDPAVAGVSTGKAIVAYRVVTNDFTIGSSAAAVQLRPGDVMADVRIARLNGDRWSRLGAVNRNPAASIRPPSPVNGPQVGIGAEGNAVVAWQEPDQTGASRIWARRVFGTTLGPPLQVSPVVWDGHSVTGEADAFAISVTAFDQARIVSRVTGGGAPSLAAPRLFLGTLEANYVDFGAKVNGPRLADGGAPPAGPLGAPAVAAGEGGVEGTMRLGFIAGASVRRVGVDTEGALVELEPLVAPTPEPAGEVVTAVNSESGLTAYEAAPAAGPAVAVRQEFRSGYAQTGLLSGSSGGSVAQLRAGSFESGDALIGFRQGEPGGFEIVAARVSAPPARFSVFTPDGWVRPRRALLRWDEAPSAVGDVHYSVVLDGRVIRTALKRPRYRPRPALLGSGKRRVRVLATDGFGGQLLGRAVTLRVDSEPPTAVLRGRGRDVTVKLADRDSGVASATCLFGDGGRASGRRSCRHRYQGPGAFTISVRERDKAGNRIARFLRVRVR